MTMEKAGIQYRRHHHSSQLQGARSMNEIFIQLIHQLQHWLQEKKNMIITFDKAKVEQESKRVMNVERKECHRFDVTFWHYLEIVR